MSFNGTQWLFKDTPTLPDSELSVWNSAFSRLFTTPIIKTNAYNFYGLIVKTSAIYLMRSDGSYSSDKIYENGIWTNENYKSFEFINEPDSYIVGSETTTNPAPFLSWLQKNASQQPELPTYIVSGNDMRNIANMIRVKTGNSETLAFPDGFINGIASIGG